MQTRSIGRFLSKIVGSFVLFALGLVSVLDASDIVIERDVAVPMADGTVLRANVFRPSAGGPFPVLVWRTPYGKQDKVDETLVRAGFIVVTQDARGRYASDGVFESFVRSETHDGSDGHDTVQWAAKLPNSTGKVGLFGTSYPGFLAWRAAGKKPAALGAMAAFSIPASYLDLEGSGTIRPGRRLKWWHSTLSPDLRRKANGPGPHTNAEATKLWAAGEGNALLHLLPWNKLPDEVFGNSSEAAAMKAWLKEPTRDPWQLEKEAANTLVPNLNVCGWYDHCNGSIDLHRAIASKGGNFNAKRHSRLIVGPWSHSALGKRKQGDVDFGPNADLDFNQLYADWFGHWLRGDKNELGRSAPIRVFVMGSNEWRNFYEWPPKYAAPHEWFLSKEDESLRDSNSNQRVTRLLSEKPATTNALDQYDYDPHDPVPTLWDAAMFTIPADQRQLANRKDVVSYQTPPQAEYIETIGYPEVVLHASSSCPDTDFFARLIDVAPDGRAIDITSGMVRARYRESLDKPAFLKPGEVTEFRIRMRPTAHRFLPGHCLRLDITSSDFPNYDRHHNTAADQNADAELVTARQTIHHGPQLRSRLILPLMRAKSDVPVWAEGATSIPPPKFVREFGSLGDKPGELHSPIGIAIDSQDRVYVTEFHNKRVQIFDAHGRSLRMISVPTQPGGIAVDSQGRIYVALMLSHNVLVFDAEGKQIADFGKSGAGDGEFNQPGGIAIGPDGSVFVVDQANHRIQHFTTDGKFLSKWGEHGNAVGQFGGDGPKNSRLSGPHFCTFDHSGNLYTTEGANLRVQRFDATGKPLFAWSGIGEQAGHFGGRPKDRTNPFAGPIGITVDHKDRVWVSSTNNRVQCFSPEGKFLTGIGDEGAEPSEFIIPHAMAIDSHGLLYVVDSSNQRVQVFELQ